jgi:TrmH family RNA methyltransferase
MKKRIISVRNAEYQIIQALKLNRAKRYQLHEVFVEGIESIKQAISAGIEITRIIVHDEAGLSDWGKDLVKTSRAQLIEMSFDLYKELCDRDEPSELLITARIAPATLAEITLPEKPFVLIFDRPSDYGNLGALIRSANAFDVDVIFVIGHGVDWYDPKAIRASLGGVFHTKIVHIQSMQELRNWIAQQKQRNNIQIIGTDSTGSASLVDYALRRPIALILGNEAKGMSVALKELCDFLIRIPISGAVNSLNVSCAGSILLWDVYKNSSLRSTADSLYSL